jgi:hypothetical protein
LTGNLGWRAGDCDDQEDESDRRKEQYETLCYRFGPGIVPAFFLSHPFVTRTVD